MRVVGEARELRRRLAGHTAVRIDGDHGRRRSGLGRARGRASEPATDQAGVPDDPRPCNGAGSRQRHHLPCAVFRSGQLRATERITEPPGQLLRPAPAGRLGGPPSETPIPLRPSAATRRSNRGTRSRRTGRRARRTAPTTSRPGPRNRRRRATTNASKPTTNTPPPSTWSRRRGPAPGVNTRYVTRMKANWLSRIATWKARLDRRPFDQGPSTHVCSPDRIATPEERHDDEQPDQRPDDAPGPQAGPRRAEDQPQRMPQSRRQARRGPEQSEESAPARTTPSRRSPPTSATAAPWSSIPAGRPEPATRWSRSPTSVQTASRPGTGRGPTPRTPAAAGWRGWRRTSTPRHACRRRR